MKHLNISTKRYSSFLLVMGLSLLGLFSCEGNLENVTYGSFSTSFPSTAIDAQAATNAMYSGLMEGTLWQAGWGAAANSIRTQASQTTDESVCYWGDGGLWTNLKSLNFTPDFATLTNHYTQLMPLISEITLYINKIQKITMDNTLKQRYVGELKALRAYYSQILYLYYGPVPIRTNVEEINNTAAPVLARPTHDAMIAQILQDYADAITVLPNTFTGTNYGRFSKAACLTARMKLYMQEKNWAAAAADGESIKSIGFSMTPDYTNNFNYTNKGGNSEILLAVVCSPTNSVFNNCWLAHALPTDYIDTTGVTLTKWGGYRMPWKTYDKFSQSDKRLSRLMQKYPIGRDAAGKIKWRDARAGGDIGAVMVKFGVDPQKVNSQQSGVDYPVFRYADVVLLLAEALNNVNNGPNQEAFDLINAVRTRAGLPNTTANDKVSFQAAIENERLFELWAEGVRRDDLIRWGKYIQRAIDDGYTNVDSHLILYPIPRKVINQSNGVIAQNPGYN